MTEDREPHDGITQNIGSDYSVTEDRDRTGKCRVCERTLVLLPSGNVCYHGTVTDGRCSGANQPPAVLRVSTRDSDLPLAAQGAALNPCLCGVRTMTPQNHGEGCPSRFLRLVGYMTPNDPTIWSGSSSFIEGRDTPVYVVAAGGAQ